MDINFVNIIAHNKSGRQKYIITWITIRNSLMGYRKEGKTNVFTLIVVLRNSQQQMPGTCN